MKYAQEQFSEALVLEAGALVQLHWEKVAPFKSIPLAPDWAVYSRLNAAGKLSAYTVRTDAGELVGYSLFVFGSLHHCITKMAVEDLIFLHPDHRKGLVGLNFIKFVDALLIQDGAEYITRRTMTRDGLDFGALLERSGYEPIDRTYVREVN